jgi:phasin family protein
MQQVEAFPSSFKRFQSVMVPLTQTNKVAVNNLDRLVNFQVDVWRSYIDFGMDRLKAAAEIRDMDSLGNFIARQWEATGHLFNKMVHDSQRLVQLGTDMSATVSDQARGMMEEGKKAVKRQ